jgi:uracil-DNA glycosylase family 4
MTDAYQQLLEATIQHLEDLKSRGTRFVSVTPELLTELAARRNAPLRQVPTPNPRASSETKTPQPAVADAKKAMPGLPRPEQKPAVAQASLLTLPGEVSTPTSKPELTPEVKAAAFAELRQRALACQKCEHLASSRKNVVFGVGNIHTDLMFVGEAPGADEDEQGEPFVGRAGELLTKIIEATGLTRSAVYIANILKCRPDTPGQTSGNRKPTADEMQTCIPFLHEQIDLIRPKVLVGLGGTAIEGLLGKTAGIMRLRGNWQTYRGIPLMPTFHPAYVLRNQALSVKRQVWEDMLKVMEKLGMPISDKQRKFFLKPAS